MKARSTIFCSVMVVLFAIALGVLMIFMPRIGQWYSEYRVLSPVVSRSVVAAFYFCSVPAGVALYCLWRLLRNIRRSDVFIKENCQLLAVISWCSLEDSLICFAVCYHYMPMGFMAVSLLFMFLIVRVVCSCMIQGTDLKNENSLTI